MICSTCNGERTIPIETPNCRIRCNDCHGFGNTENKEKYESKFKSLMARAIMEVAMNKELQDLSDGWMDFRCSEYQDGRFLTYDECGDCYECKLLTKAMDKMLEILE